MIYNGLGVRVYSISFIIQYSAFSIYPYLVPARPG